MITLSMEPDSVLASEESQSDNQHHSTDVVDRLRPLCIHRFSDASTDLQLVLKASKSQRPAVI